MIPPDADRPKLVATLAALVSAVEDLTLGGLTTASDSTRKALEAATAEAARFRLLRLGSSLRATNEELARFARQDSSFSRKRLTFFLGRSWLLGRGLRRALEAGDGAEYDRLAWTPPNRPLAAVEVVCLGALKKVAVGSFVAYEFRLRTLADADFLPAGSRLTWSAVFPARPGVDVPPECYLHLPQKQKFLPTVFLDRSSVVVKNCAVTIDDSGGGRLAFGETSTVAAGPRFEDWFRFLDWTPVPARGRLAAHRPGPLDLETELQEEVVLRDWTVGEPSPGEEPGQVVYPVTAGPFEFRAVAGPEVESGPLRAALATMGKSDAARPPLFGLMHYERRGLVLQPLATIGPGGPEYLNISKDKVDKAALVRAMSFT